MESALVDHGGARPSRPPRRPGHGSARTPRRVASAVSCFESRMPSRSNPSGRITAAATSGPASAPRPASSTPATRVEALLSEGTLVAVHGGRSRSPDPSCARRRPDLHERLPDHLVDRHVAEPLRRREPGVPGVEPVVAQHEQHAIGNRLGPVGAPYRSGASGRARRPRSPSTNSRPARISQVWPGSADHPLDEVLVLRLRHPDPFAEPVQEPAHDPAFGARPADVGSEKTMHVAAMDVATRGGTRGRRGSGRRAATTAPSTATG